MHLLHWTSIPHHQFHLKLVQLVRRLQPTGIASNQEVDQDKATQIMHTNNNGRATFTVEIGPKSDLGIYDTELEVTKDTINQVSNR